jgi:hypothetical protein
MPKPQQEYKKMYKKAPQPKRADKEEEIMPKQQTKEELLEQLSKARALLSKYKAAIWKGADEQLKIKAAETIVGQLLIKLDVLILTEGEPNDPGAQNEGK